MIFKHIIPDVYLKSIYHLNTAKLKEKGINSLLLDLDNTLVEHTVDKASSSLIDWINSLQSEGFKVMILSNNIKKRVSKLAKLIDIPFIHLAKKPFAVSFVQALGRLESTAKETAVIGDQLFTDVLGGNRMNMFTILVVPISEHDRWYTRLNRWLERFALSYLKKNGHLKWEEN